MENRKEQALNRIKAYSACFGAAVVILYLLMGFISWEWNISNWYWPVRLLHIAMSGYLSYCYGGVYLAVFHDDTDENNFFYESSRSYND